MAESSPKRCRHRLAAALAWVACTAAAAADPATALRLVTTHFPPYAVEAGPEHPGPLARLGLAVIARAGHSGSVSFVPWPRAQAMAQSDSQALIIPLVRSPDREAAYQWIGALHCRRLGLVALRGRLDRFDAEAMAGAHVALLRATPYRMAPKARAVQEANSFEDMAKLLQLGGVDALYGNQETILQALRARGVERAALALSAPLESDALWLAASPGMAKASVDALRRALQALEKDGSMDRLLEQGGLSRADCRQR